MLTFEDFSKDKSLFRKGNWLTQLRPLAKPLSLP